MFFPLKILHMLGSNVFVSNGICWNSNIFIFEDFYDHTFWSLLLGSHVNSEKNDSCAARVDFPSVLFLVAIMDTHSVKLSSDLTIFPSTSYVGISSHFYLNKSPCWLIRMLKFINVFSFRTYKNRHDFSVEEILQNQRLSWLKEGVPRCNFRWNSWVEHVEHDLMMRQ